MRDCSATPARAARLAAQATFGLVPVLLVAVLVAPDTRRPRRAHDARELEAASLGEVVRVAEHRDWAIRWNAVNELGQRRDRRAIPPLTRRALTDRNSHPRWRALWALKTLDPTGSTAVPAFLAELRRPDGDAAHHAAVALAFFDRAEGRAVLLRALVDPDSFRRWEAVYSLGFIGNREVIGRLARRLAGTAEPHEKVRGQMALTLGRIGGPDAVAALLETLAADDSSEVRWRAALALSGCAHRPLGDDLAAILRLETDSRVREQIKHVLRQAGRFTPRPKEVIDASDR